MPAIPTLPAIAGQPLSVVLLAHDARDHVEALLTEWASFLDARGDSSELLLVDDGSSDGTADRARALVEQIPRLRVLALEQPQGEGVALRTGLEAAQKPLIFCTLCRPEYRPADLARLLDRPSHDGKCKEIDQVHLLSGYRAGCKVPWPLRVVGWLWRLFCVVVLAYSPPRLPGWLGPRRHLGQVLARFVFGIRYRDVACPFRLLRRDILPRIPIQSCGPFAHVELLAKANFLGHLMGEEMPLDVVPPPYRGDLRLWLRDGVRLFNRPDFGPAVLPSAS
jgi:glycosyltransferase involved in cell wall biosynthesis